jgi:ABC-type transporter Mla maintaining outer membrane lipid asymmetry ATPase subunit MlaF
MSTAESKVTLRGITKDYRGLRPLRISAFELREGQTVALLGLDQAMAEVLVRLIMGASVPDSGEVIVFGQSTASIEDGEAWLRSLDRFALLSDRAILVDQLTAEQAIALPISFDVDEKSGEVRKTVRGLAAEAGLDPEILAQPVGTLSPATRVRVRLCRAMVVAPQLLLAEHPTASLSPVDTAAFAADFSRVVRKRRVTTLVMTADSEFAHAVSDSVLALQPSTGALTEVPAPRPSGPGSPSRWRRWFKG